MTKKEKILSIVILLMLLYYFLHIRRKVIKYDCVKKGIKEGKDAKSIAKACFGGDTKK